MKKIVLCIALSFLTNSIFAQDGSNENKSDDVAFAVIEDVPVYRGCEKEQGNKALKKCMSIKITEHVVQNFNTSLANNIGLGDGIQKIYVQFRINRKGKTDKIRVRGPHKKLEKEAVRVIKLIPQMTPGKVNEDAVGVLYSLPIKFKIEGTTKETPKEKRNRRKAEKRAKKNN